MDLFRALLGMYFPDTEDSSAPPQTANRLYPRIPALFEPMAPRADLESFEETADEVLNESAQEDRRAARPSPSVSTGTPREREPYRGVMNPPHPLPAANAQVQLSQNDASRSIEPGIERATELPTNPVGQQTRPQTPAPIHSLRPAPSVEPRRGETRTESQQDVLSSTIPIIRITIGRIVVRAVSETPPPPPKREVKSTKMSLDDYLKKRERGER